DILSPQAIKATENSLTELQTAIDSNVDREALEKQMEQVENTANKWLKPYPNAAWRENVEVLLVALTVAMGIRTFFLQPFKIPTGAMQPTLFGVTSVNLAQRPEIKKPPGLVRLREWFEGISYIHEVAEGEGPLTQIDPPFRILIFNMWQTYVQA